MLRLVILVLITGCGALEPKKATVAVPLDMSRLEKKIDIYSEELGKHRDEFGFIMTDACDSTLFSGLLSAALPGTVDLPIARGPLGEWHRRPRQDCGPHWGNSRSTFSRDMMIGVLYYLWYNKDLDAAVDLMELLRSNFYYMPGEGTAGELLMNPAIMNTLAQIIKDLGGDEYKIELALPVVFGRSPGYVAHLTALHIHLRGQVMGRISAHNLDIIEYHRARQPRNPLFHAVYHKYLDGNMQAVVNLLLNDSVYPEGRTPTTLDRCSPWVIERDFSVRDWGPCPDRPVKEHTGAELLVIYHLFLK